MKLITKVTEAEVEEGKTGVFQGKFLVCVKANYSPLVQLQILYACHLEHYS